MKEFFKKNKIAIISAIAVLVVVVVIVTVLLSNKKTNSNNNEIVNNETSQVETDDGDYITNKEWIIMYAEKFGLNEYLEDEPYFENVAADESFFGYVQTMVEYEILDDTSELKLDETISPETVLIQLAKIYGDTYIENRFEKKELEKTDYIKFATENIGITIKDGAKGITNEEAISIIDRTWEHYLTKEYGNVEEIVYKDNVMDFISCGDYVLQDNTLYIASEKEISEGAVLVLATKDEYHSLIALKVTEVDKNDTNYILEVADPELEDIVEYMNLEFSEVINLDNFKPAEGVTVVETTTVGAGFNNDQKGTVTTLEVNITDKKLKVSPEWEAINAKLNITESKMYNKNYLIGQAGQVIPKYKSGYEAIGKIKIKDLILNGSVEYDNKLAFDFNVGATAEFSLALKGYLKGNRMKVGEIEVRKPFSPVTFAIDFYVFVDFEGEIKVEPKITSISTVKKTKNSGVTATGNVKTDTKVEFKASASVEAAPDAVLVLFEAVDIVDAYMKIGAKAEMSVKKDKLTIDMYLPTLKVGVGLNKNTVLSSIGISIETKVVDKDKAIFKCPFRYTLEYPLLKEPAEEKPTEPPTTEAPTQKPTEPPTTEATTQKPTEPPTTEVPTQKPTEPPTTEVPTQKPTEPVTQPSLPKYELSAQTYDYAGKFGDNYLVRVGELYGVVNYNGDVIIPIQYEDYNGDGDNECEFIKGNMTYIYNIDSCKMVYQFANVEEITNPESYQIVIDEDSTYDLYNPEYDGKYYVYRQYNCGLLIETINYIQDYPLGGYDFMSLYTFIDTKSDNVILKENGLIASEYYYGYPGGGLYVSANSENEIVLLSSNRNDGKLYMYVISNQGYNKICVDSYFGDASVNPYKGDVYIGSGFYNGDWLMFPRGSGKMFNVSTCEWLTMPYTINVMDFGITTNIYSGYNGRGLWYGANTSEGGLYDLVKGDRIISSGYEWLSFGDDYIRARKDGVTQFIDYNSGQAVKQYKASVNFVDGKALVDDGNGLCYIDKSFNRVSEYIYTGVYDDFTIAGIKINGKYHLIKQ